MLFLQTGLLLPLVEECEAHLELSDVFVEFLRLISIEGMSSRVVDDVLGSVHDALLSDTVSAIIERCLCREAAYSLGIGIVDALSIIRKHIEHHVE